MNCALIDTHAHLTDAKLKSDVSALLARADAAGVIAVINAGYDLASSRLVVDLASRYPQCYGVVGIQPSDAPSALDGGLDEIASLLANPRVVGIGEIGLDYYWNQWPRDVQAKAFAAQIVLAKEHGLPFVVHDRDAHGDVLSLLREHAPYPAGFVMHCFSGSAELAEECVRLGGYISLAGPVTFKNASRPVAVARAVPLERLLVETDCPYLAPHPHRGKRNEPGYLPLIASRIAEIRGLDVCEVARATTANARRVFGRMQVDNHDH